MLKYLGYLVRNTNNAVTEIHVRIIAGHKYHRALGQELNEIHNTLSRRRAVQNVVQQCRITDPEG